MAAQPVLRYVIGGIDRKTRVVFTGADRTVLSLIDGDRLRRFDLATGRPVGDQGGRKFPAPILDASPDGALVVTAAEIPGRSRTTWDVRVFDADSGLTRAQLPPLESEAVGSEVVFDPNGRYMSLKLPLPKERGGQWDSSFRMVWRLDTATPVRTPGDFLDRHSTRTEDRLIAVQGGRTVLLYPEKPAPFAFSDRLVFWDLDAGKSVARIEPEAGPIVSRCGNTEAGYADCAFDGTYLVFVLDSGRVRWWDVATGRPARPDWCPRRATSAATLAGDGRTMAVRCDDNRVRYYDLASGQECGPTPILRGSRASISPQGSFLLARRGDDLAVWQVKGAPRPAHPSAIDGRGPFYTAMAAAPDGEEYTVGDTRANGSAMGRDTFKQLTWLTGWAQKKATAIGSRLPMDAPGATRSTR